MPKKTKDLDTLENYVQNSIAQTVSIGGFNLVTSPINEFTQTNIRGIETNDNLNEKRETIKEMNKLEGRED